MDPSTVSSELASSSLRAPHSSLMRLPRGTRPNSDDDNDDDDLRLTRSQSRASAEAEGHPNPDPDAPSAPAAAPSSSSSPSQPKADNSSSVPAAATAAAAVTPNPSPNVPFKLSLTLRNTGSVARDHLSSERTFLAYVRTSLSFASAGVALVQLFRVSVSASVNSSGASKSTVSSYARPLGATLIAFGMVVLVIGTHRYFRIQRALPQGIFPAARLSVFLQAVSLATLVGIVFGILVAVR